MSQKLTAASVARSTAHSLVTWEWTKALVYWLILSAGTASDLVFLMASFWMSVNANVHGLILRYMNEDTATYITYLATTAYVALPIFIVGLAVVQTVGHVKMWRIGGFWSKIWAIIFGIPAVIFLIMDFVTISCSVANVTFTMPMFFVILRADSAFIFAFGSLVFFFLGKPQERERLQEKDTFIESLRQEKDTFIESLRQEKDTFIAELKRDNERNLFNLRQEKDTMIADLRRDNQSLIAKVTEQNSAIEKQNQLLAESKNAQSELLKAVNKSSDMALQAYSEECIAWLKSGVKTVLVEEITRFTGHTKRRIEGAIKKGLLQTATRNESLILVSSLVEWLKNNPPVSARGEQETGPILHIVNG